MYDGVDVTYFEIKSLMKMFSTLRPDTHQLKMAQKSVLRHAAIFICNLINNALNFRLLSDLEKLK